MSTAALLVSIHLAGEGKDEIVLDTQPGNFTITRTEEALTPSAGLAAWRDFLKRSPSLNGWPVIVRWCAPVPTPRQCAKCCKAFCWAQCSKANACDCPFQKRPE